MGSVIPVCQVLWNPPMNTVIKVKGCSLAMPVRTGIALNVAHGVILSHSLVITGLYEKINKTVGYDWDH